MKCDHNLETCFQSRGGNYFVKILQILEAIKFSLEVQCSFPHFKSLFWKWSKTEKVSKCGSIFAELCPLFCAGINFLECWRIIWFLFNLHVQIEFEFKYTSKSCEQCLEIIFLGSGTLLKFTFKISQLLEFNYDF